MKLERLTAALAPTSVIGRTGVEIRDLAYDARAVAPGALFFCVPGARFDGHEFAPEAVERGAVALVVERPVDVDVPQLVVADARHPRAVRRTAEAIALQRTFREMLAAGNRSCAMEATSHGSELHRLDCVRFAVLVFTNLSQDHLDFHGTMERYFEAKRRLFAGVPAAVNLGDEWGCRLARELQGERVLT